MRDQASDDFSRAATDKDLRGFLQRYPDTCTRTDLRGFQLNQPGGLDGPSVVGTSYRDIKIPTTRKKAKLTGNDWIVIYADLVDNPTVTYCESIGHCTPIDIEE